MQLRHDDDRRISQVHLLIPQHQSSDASPMRREVKIQPDCFAFQQLKQRIQIQPIFAQKIYNLGQDRFTDKHGRPHAFEKRDSPFVVWIVTIEIREEWARVTDRDHWRRNLAREFVAGNRLPDKLPARSAVIAYTDPRSWAGASIRSRTSAATLHPLWRACSLSCRTTASGSLTVIPFIRAMYPRVTQT
jgi:hypothetical protein